jgi:hypothetical protein
MKLTKSGVVIDIPDTEISRYLRSGYVPFIEVRKSKPIETAEIKPIKDKKMVSDKKKGAG